MGRKGALAKLESDRPASVDHEVEPAVLLGHGVTLVVKFGVGHPNTDEATTGGGQNAASNDCGSAINEI